MPCYCSITTSAQAIFDGTHILASSGSASTTRNCYLARLDSSSQLHLCASGSKPAGMFYDHLDLIYQITIASGTVDCIDINAYNAGRYTNIAMGNFQVLVGADAFVEGSVPATGSTLYEGAGGKMTITPGTYSVGKCLNGGVTMQHRSGAYSVAQLQMEFDHL